MPDLAVIVADKNMEFALKGILEHPRRLGIRTIRFKIQTHPGKDGGVRSTGPEVLARLHEPGHRGLLMLDWEGSGAVGAPLDLEASLDRRLVQTWGGDAKAIVIEPEVDAWVWGSNNLMSEVLDWSENESVRHWLENQDFEFINQYKPVRPKEALERVLLHLRIPRSSNLYRKLTSRISLRHCVDPAFLRLKSVLQFWFPQ